MTPPFSRRQAPRRPDYDYRAHAWYFVTLVADRRLHLFGKMGAVDTEPSPLGRLVQDEWARIPDRWPGVELDESRLMPDHHHGLVLLPGDGPSLSAVINALKAGITRRAREVTEIPGLEVFQRGYFDRVVRSSEELAKFREYMKLNPERWRRKFGPPQDT